MNNRWLQIMLLLALLGLSKAQHFIKLVILAGLGLAGLWMVHTLAQDYNNISQTRDTSTGGEFKIFNKRSAPGQDVRINWEFVLSRDPVSCARSFICQLAAQQEQTLTREEKMILEITRNTAESDTWASKQLQEALKHGEQVTQPNQCLKIYKFCPYTSQTMMTLLRAFGR